MKIMIMILRIIFEKKEIYDKFVAEKNEKINNWAKKLNMVNQRIILKVKIRYK